MTMSDDELVSGAEQLLADMNAQLSPDLRGVPWDIYEEDEGPDVFDDYSVWCDDGQPGTAYIAQGIGQGSDEGLACARFIAASPAVVNQLCQLARRQAILIVELNHKVDVAEAFLNRGIDQIEVELEANREQ